MLAPPVAIIVCTLTAMWVLSRGVNPFLVGSLRAAYWLPAFPLAIALAWKVAAGYRLWKWARGEADTVPGLQPQRRTTALRLVSER